MLGTIPSDHSPRLSNFAHIGIVAAFTIALCGCSVQVRLGKPSALKVHQVTEQPWLCNGDPTFDENGAVNGCDDFTEPPYDNHFPACPWHDADTLTCDSVT
jgi:hypothetical protein